MVNVERRGKNLTRFHSRTLPHKRHATELKLVRQFKRGSSTVRPNPKDTDRQSYIGPGGYEATSRPHMHGTTMKCPSSVPIRLFWLFGRHLSKQFPGFGICS
jgi:hypothetical protein